MKLPHIWLIFRFLTGANGSTAIPNLKMLKDILYFAVFFIKNVFLSRKKRFDPIFLGKKALEHIYTNFLNNEQQKMKSHFQRDFAEMWTQRRFTTSTPLDNSKNSLKVKFNSIKFFKLWDSNSYIFDSLNCLPRRCTGKVKKDLSNTFWRRWD